MIERYRNHPNHVVLGIGIIAIGLWLIFNDHFFLWPPSAVQFVNDDFWGALFIFDGISVLVWVLYGHDSIVWNRALLTITSFLIAFLTGYQFVIWVATGMYMSWISNAIITAFVLILARRSDTKDGQ